MYLRSQNYFTYHPGTGLAERSTPSKNPQYVHLHTTTKQPNILVQSTWSFPNTYTPIPCTRGGAKSRGAHSQASFLWKSRWRKVSVSISNVFHLYSSCELSCLLCLSPTHLISLTKSMFNIMSTMPTFLLCRRALIGIPCSSCPV